MADIDWIYFFEVNFLLAISLLQTVRDDCRALQKNDRNACRPVKLNVIGWLGMFPVCIGQSSCGMSSIDSTRLLRSVHTLIKQFLFYLFLSLLIKVKIVAKPSSCQWSSSKIPCNCGFIKSFAMSEIVEEGFVNIMAGRGRIITNFLCLSMQISPVLSDSCNDRQKRAIYCFHKMIVDIFSGERVKRYYNFDGRLSLTVKVYCISTCQSVFSRFRGLLARYTLIYIMSLQAIHFPQVLFLPLENLNTL